MERYGPCLIVSGAQNADGTWKDDSSYGASMRRFFNGVILPKLPSPYNTETLYGATLQCGVDGLAKATLLCTKKSVSAILFNLVVIVMLSLRKGTLSTTFMTQNAL